MTEHDYGCCPPSLEVALHGCRVSVARSGWHCVGVFDDPAAGGVPCAYTIGLSWTFRAPSPQPELVIAGLDPHQGYGVLTAAVALVENGATLKDGYQADRVLADAPVRFRALDLSRCSVSFGVSDAFYGRPVARLQLLWPDPAGLFPGEQGCDAEAARWQMIGGLPPARTTPQGRVPRAASRAQPDQGPADGRDACKRAAAPGLSTLARCPTSRQPAGQAGQPARSRWAVPPAGRRSPHHDQPRTARLSRGRPVPGREGDYRCQMRCSATASASRSSAP